MMGIVNELAVALMKVARKPSACLAHRENGGAYFKVTSASRPSATSSPSSFVASPAPGLKAINTLLGRSAPATLFLLAIAASAHAAEDYKLKSTDFITGVREPWSIAFLSQDRALITEKGGRLRMVQAGKLLPAPVNGTPAVNDGGQGGLLDVAVDPDYATNGWVYLSYSHPAATDSNAAMTRIVRGKLVAGAWTSEQVLFEAKPEHYRKAGVHFGCRIVFDSKGHLYFAIGDRGAQNQAQDVTRPNGKTFRINRDGTIPADNPFVKTPNAYPAIFSFGNRNAQGLAIDPKTDMLWATEHGPLGGDELNLIQAGRNYGWPVITFGKNYNGTTITELTAKEGMEQPVVQWTPSPAMCGLDFLTGPMFPKWEGNLLAGALKFQEVKRLVIVNNKVVQEEIIFSKEGRVRDVVTGPEGAIYVVLNGPDKVVRLTPE